MSDLIHNNGDGQEKGRKRRFEYISTYSVADNEKPSADALDPKKLVYTILRYKWLVLFLMISGGVSAWFYANSLTPSYQSSGTLMINTGTSADDELSRIISQTTGVGTSSTLANELQILQSREFARQIAEKLLEEDPGTISDFPVLWSEDEEGIITRRQEAAVAGRIRRNLSAERLERDSDIVQLSYSSSSPLETAYIVNTAMDIYVESSTRQNRQAAELTTEFLEQEREDIKRKLEESEQRLRNYMDNTGIIQIDQQSSAIVSQRTEIELEIQRVNLELNTIEEAISNHERQLERIRPGLADEFSEAIGPRIRNSQEQLALYENERTLIIQRNPGVLERDPTPPRLVFLNNQIERLKTEIKQLSSQLFTEDDEFMGMDTAERAQILADIQTRLVELRIEENQYKSRREALAERREEIDNTFQDLPDEILELARLQREVEINEDLFLSVSQKFADMSVLKQSQFGFGRIIDDALVPAIPVSPNKNMLTVVGIMFGMIFSIGIILIRDFMDHSINNVDLLKEFPLPLLSAIPVLEKVPEKKKKTFQVGDGKIPDEMIMIRDRAHIVSESVRRLKNNLIYQYGDKPPKTIAITSAEKGDGKSTIAANLGVAFAEAGYKTLLVDTDFRRSTLHRNFGLNNTEGLSDYLQGNLPVIKLFKNSDHQNLKIITSGKAFLPPESVVNSKEFVKFQEKMEEYFDVIIFDTPPFGIISDSTALLKRAAATVMVTRYRKTNRGIFVKTIEELERIGANISGIVLNAFDHKRDSGSSYGSGYYQSLYSNYEAYVDQ